MQQSQQAQGSLSTNAFLLGRPLEGPAWMGWILRLAGFYNIAWGAFTVFLPQLPWDWIGLAEPRYMFLWQCIGMIVGVYGVGYWAAGARPYTHWPIVLVGLLGKVFGPIGFVYYVLLGQIDPAFGLAIAGNDLIWWVPFGLMLWGSWRWHRAKSISDVKPHREAVAP